MKTHFLTAIVVAGLCVAAASLQAQTPAPTPTPAPARTQTQTNSMYDTNLPPATPPLAATNGISLSNYTHPLTDVRRMNRRDDPKSSRDRHFDWWPRFGKHQLGTNDWLQYTFEKASTVSESKVYWFDDEPTGGCRIPVEWRITYLDGEQWKPVEATGPFSVTKNAYDAVAFKAVTTTALRLEVKFQTNYSVGVESWKVK
jgi:hypothetical protein